MLATSHLVRLHQRFRNNHPRLHGWLEAHHLCLCCLSACELTIGVLYILHGDWYAMVLVMSGFMKDHTRIHQ